MAELWLLSNCSRLPRLIGLSAASDMILTGYERSWPLTSPSQILTKTPYSREVKAEEAKNMNLVNYLVQRKQGEKDAAFHKALEVARLITSHPEVCMRNDRSSMLENAYNQEEKGLLEKEFAYGLNTLNDPSFGKAVQAFVNKAKM